MIRRPILFLLLLMLLAVIASCAKPRPVRLPPVTEGWRKPSAHRNAYIVQTRDTLYSIAWAFGMDYRDLADINQLQAPYSLRVGQHLYITPLPKSAKCRKENLSLKFVNRVKSTKLLFDWIWPASGKIIAPFNPTPGGNKGIDIGGFLGATISACNNGIVVYSGEGIRSYGKLIIIKHNDDYLSAYAYNQHMQVKEGQKIVTGQKIATMGANNDGRAALHFEIRRFGKPINPLLYLPKK